RVLRFDVVDTGVGMSEAEVGRLFEPFYSSDARPDRESGAGLGLAISRRLAELLGGRIAVRSRPGEGSHFTLTLPIPAQSGAAAAPARARPGRARGARVGPAPAPATVRGTRILLAEDNEAIRRLVAIRLQQAGAEVVVARNGQEAVEQALAAREAGRPFGWI